MELLNTILHLLTLAALGVGSFLLATVKKGTESALLWPGQFARELEKTRGVERQEQRFKSYGKLWMTLRPLALYDPSPLDRTTAGALSTALSDWYFSECGGLFMTTQVRDFYFALQDLLRAVSATPADWEVERSTADQRPVFYSVLANAAGGTTAVLDYFEKKDFARWQDEAAALATVWKQGIQKVTGRWAELAPPQRFATLQQAGSILRSSLTNDIESRLP